MRFELDVYTMLDRAVLQVKVWRDGADPSLPESFSSFVTLGDHDSRSFLGLLDLAAELWGDSI
jgi:hypothetical protein